MRGPGRLRVRLRRMAETDRRGDHRLGPRLRLGDLPRADLPLARRPDGTANLDRQVHVGRLARHRAHPGLHAVPHPPARARSRRHRSTVRPGRGRPVAPRLRGNRGGLRARRRAARPVQSLEPRGALPDARRTRTAGPHRGRRRRTRLRGLRPPAPPAGRRRSRRLRRPGRRLPAHRHGGGGVEGLEHPRLEMRPDRLRRRRGRGRLRAARARGERSRLDPRRADGGGVLRGGGRMEPPAARLPVGQPRSPGGARRRVGRGAHGARRRHVHRLPRFRAAGRTRGVRRPHPGAVLRAARRRNPHGGPQLRARLRIVLPHDLRDIHGHPHRGPEPDGARARG